MIPSRCSLDPFSLTLIAYSEAVADNLGKVGVRAKITPLDRAALSTKRQAKALAGDLWPWSTPNRSLAIHIVIMHTLHHSQAPFTSTADGKIHTNDAVNQKIALWDLGRNLYDNNPCYIIRR